MPLYSEEKRPLLRNPGFELYSNGTSNTATGKVVSDYWVMTLGTSSTCTATKETTTVDTGAASLKLVYVQSANSTIAQTLAEISPYKGHNVAFSVKVNSSVKQAIRPYLSTDGGTTKSYGPYHTGNDGSAAWQELGVAVAVPSSATSLVFGLSLEKSDTFYVDTAIAAFGGNPGKFRPGVGLIEPDHEQYTFKIPLVASDSAGGVLSWTNPFATAVIVDRLVVDVTTAATGACTIDFGTTATTSTTSSDTLCDGLDVNSAAGVFDNITDKGTNGKSRQRLASGKWVTGSMASGATAGLVGNAYLTVTPII